MINKIFTILHYICILFLLSITLYAFAISILNDNIWNAFFWGLSEGVVVFSLLFNLEMGTVPNVITDERSLIGQIITILILTVVAALTSTATFILLIIDMALSISVFLLEKRFCKF